MAALGVLVFHVLIVSDARGTNDLTRHLAFGGAFGVYLFFALSGYLLFTPFARAALGGPSVDLARYARNRALRILPLYYVVLATVLIVQEDGGTFAQWWRFATFTESFFLSTVNTVNGPMWSLAVELEFYVLLPLIGLAVAKLARGSRAGAAMIVVALAIASIAVWWVTVYQPARPDPRWRYSLPATFFHFTPGMLVALLRIELERRPRRLPRADLLVVSGVAIWAVAAYQPRASSLIVVLASFFILAAVALPLRGGLLLRLLDLRALVAVGLVSYSLYLWQLPVIEATAERVDLGFAPLLALSLIACLASAFVSYFVVERVFLRMRERWGPTLAVPPDHDTGPRRGAVADPG